jgi:predicted phage baseplate assembly protein
VAGNPPGRSGLAYRSGTHGTVLARMLADLPSRLPELTVHATDDAGVAMLDAWATVADVVTFYQERIANEGFLRTATENESVRHLARSIGYELHPGVAAATHLAFAVETAPGAPTSAVVAAGTRVMSVPGQGEVPQTFETADELVADVARNEARLRRGRPQAIVRGLRRLWLDGVTTGLRPGDAIVVVGAERATSPGSERWDVRILRTVEEHPAQAPGEPSTTLVTWDLGLGTEGPHPVEPAHEAVEVHALRQRVALFGHNAPAWRTMPDEVRARYGGPNQAELKEWPGFALPGVGDDPVIDLDAAYPGVAVGSWLVLARPGYEELYRVARVELSARENFGMAAKTTRVWLDAEEHLSWFGIRATTVYARSERLALAEEPLVDRVTGPDLVLDGEVPLVEGAPVVVTGTGATGPSAEAATVVRVGPGAGVTNVRLAGPLATPLDVASVRVLGNVVAATHGETVADEVLGSGDGTATHQRFTLRREDVTHLSAPTPAGVVTTVEVRVDGVAWAPAPSLVAAGPHDPVFVARQDERRTSVTFGDGVRGARLPTGQENVRARYRTGIGPAGNVGAGALSLLPQRPLGISSVANPLAAAGGAAPEALAEARANASLTVLTLDRVVSLRDHEDFARAFGGIAKARAVALWSGQSTVVHVTVAAPGGVPASPTHLANLRAALDAVRDPAHEVRIEDRRSLTFRVAVAVLTDAAHERTVVHEAVAGALRAAFAFEVRDFARPVTVAHVLTVAQGVPGVTAVNVTRLHLADRPPGREPVIVAHDARGDAPAELLLVDPTGVEVTEAAS